MRPSRWCACLWLRETEGRVFDSPERKAALDKALRDKIMTIRDPSIRGHYEQEIKDLSWQLFRPQRKYKPTPRATGPKGRWQPAPAPATPAAKASALVSAEGASADHLREAVILAALATCPEVIEDFRSQNLRDCAARTYRTAACGICCWRIWGWTRMRCGSRFPSGLGLIPLKTCLSSATLRSCLVFVPRAMPRRCG